KEIELEELEWPAPKTFIAEGDILGYGYEGEYSLFYRLPKNLTGELEVNSNWLVCKHICIPGKGNLKHNISANHKGLVGEKKFDLSETKILEHFKKLPQEKEEVEGLQMELVSGSDNKSLKLIYQLQTKGKLGEHQNLLMPFTH